MEKLTKTLHLTIFKFSKHRSITTLHRPGHGTPNGDFIVISGRGEISGNA